MFNVVVVWLTSDCFHLHCIAVRSSPVCVVERGAVGLHHLVSRLFQFHRIAALVINTVPIPFPFARVVSHRCHGIHTRNIEGLCNIFRFRTRLCPELRDHSCTRRLLLAP